jgi:leader peptidase (prepilin peptidase)/N-methyltransferase
MHQEVNMTVLVFIYGLIIGSFLNVCIYRIPRNESVVFPSSHCPNCNHYLKWYDNIPLFSYIFLGGKCRYCKAPISIQYPIVETLNALIYLILFYYFSFSIDFIFYALISSVLVVITFIDLKEMIIPDALVITILILSVVYKAVNYFTYDINPQILSSLGGLLLAGGLFLAIVILSKGGMGGGDVTLIAALGFILGHKFILFNIFLSFILGAVISLILLLTKIKTRKDPIPFGPFIILAFFITIIWGEGILSLYINLIT